MSDERDKRAGDRAARAWARDDAAGLRQPAGQISILTDLIAARPTTRPRCATPSAATIPPT